MFNQTTLLACAVLTFSCHAWSQDTPPHNTTVKSSEYNDMLLSDGLKVEVAKMQVKVEATGRRYKILSVAGKIKEKEARGVYEEYVTLQLELETLNEKLATTLIEEEKDLLDAEKAKVKADKLAKAEQEKNRLDVEKAKLKADMIEKAEKDRPYAILTDELCDEARKKLLDGNTAEAFQIYTKVIDKNPNSCEAYNGLGDCYLRMINDIGNLSKALKCYTKSIELDQSKSRPYANRAHVYLKIGQHIEDAYADITKAIELEPSESTYYCLRSEILIQMSRRDDALKDLDRAIVLDSGCMDYYALRMGIYYTMGLSNKWSDDVERAIKCKRISNSTVYNLNSVKSFVFCLKGRKFAENGDSEDALEWYGKAMNEDTKYYLPYSLRGDLYKSCNRRNESQEDYAKAEELKKIYPAK